jgi:hypothetical protein
LQQRDQIFGSKTVVVDTSGEVMLLTVRISLWVDILILGKPLTGKSSF